MIYLDSSALVKLAVTEPESAALAAWLAERAPAAGLQRAAPGRGAAGRLAGRARRAAPQLPPDQADRAGRADLRRTDNSATLPPQALSPAHAITWPPRWPSGAS